jgi:hypothetical protein
MPNGVSRGTNLDGPPRAHDGSRVRAVYAEDGAQHFGPSSADQTGKPYDLARMYREADVFELARSRQVPHF